MEFSRCPPALVRPNEKAAPGRGLSKLSSTRYVEVDVLLGELETGRDHHGRAAPGDTRAPDSLERR